MFIMGDAGLPMAPSIPVKCFFFSSGLLSQGISRKVSLKGTAGWFDTCSIAVSEMTRNVRNTVYIRVYLTFRQ